MIVSFLPAEGLDNLVAATGFNLQDSGYEYKYAWLLERIGILRDQAEAGNIWHDNPDAAKIMAVVLQQRRELKAQASTIAALQAELEKLRRQQSWRQTMTATFDQNTGFLTLTVDQKDPEATAKQHKLYRQLKQAGSNLTEITEDGSVLSVPVTAGPKGG